MENEKNSKVLQVATFIAYGRIYAVELKFITEIIYYKAITPLPKSPRFIEGIIELRKRVLPVMNLKSHLSPQRKRASNPEHILIVKINGQRAGIIVDKAQTILSIPEHSIQVRGNDSDSFIQGVFKHQDNIIMLIDVNRLLSKSQIKSLKAAV